MSYNNWDLHFLPQRHSFYTPEQISEELINCAKAFHTCKPVATVYAACRRSPEGRLVEPEICLFHAESLMNCYNLVKTIPGECKEIHEKLKTCLDSKGKCEAYMNEYVSCEHPASIIYKDYPSLHLEND